MSTCESLLDVLLSLPESILFAETATAASLSGCQSFLGDPRPQRSNFFIPCCAPRPPPGLPRRVHPPCAAASASSVHGDHSVRFETWFKRLASIGD